MTTEEIQNKVIELVANKLEISKDSVKLETDFKNELGVDSLDYLYIIMDLEDEFMIDIYESELDGKTTIKELADYVETRIKCKDEKIIQLPKDSI